MIKKILIITCIKPDAINRNGPSGLLWEVANTLKLLSYEIEYYIEDKNNILNKLGLYYTKLKINYDAYDRIIVYPMNLSFKIAEKYRHKCIVLGPDSSSFLFTRFYKKTAETKAELTKNWLLSKWFYLQEIRIVKQFLLLVVVGKNDRYWLKKITNFKYENIFYLNHPILSSVVGNLEKRIIEGDRNIKAIVLSGDLSKKYTGKLITDILNELLKFTLERKIKLLIIGKNNKWIYQKACVLNKNNTYVEFIEWINDYREICDPRYYIHLIPLQAGAGTKNRTLTACALGAGIVSTRIGIENIYYFKPKNKIRIFNSSKEILISLRSIIREEDNVTIDDLKKFTENIQQHFKDSLKTILMEY